ncbi:hypothetical protein [Bacillus toyonensis]|uniref:hypothetical protein n=1 Tax=Bacillus toyonensis TaxID=155322 RepID=UPI000BF083AB|nr:hypothetical protein [Bacillus toyonensis]PEL24302.1 hypothetical protein CN624_18055 [Bacillus toyonensis]
MTNYHNVSVRLNEVDKQKLDDIQLELNKTANKLNAKGMTYADVLRFSLDWLNADMVSNNGIDIDRNNEELVTMTKDKLDLLIHSKAMELLKDMGLSNVSNSTNTNTKVNTRTNNKPKADKPAVKKEVTEKTETK